MPISSNTSHAEAILCVRRDLQAMAVSADLRSANTVHESSPPAATAQLRTAGGLATVGGQRRRRRRPPTLLRRGESSAGPRPMLPPRLPASRQRWPASTPLPNRRSLAGGGAAGDMCEGFVFWETDRRARGEQGEDASDQHSASAATQTRPRFGPGLGRPGRRGHPF